MVDNVNHPKHYKLPGGGETIDFIESAWGDWEYEYHERHRQLLKAQELISRSTGEESQHGK